MKNFKRVISAVIALALSASTLVAVSASKFTDVDNTNYAEAIDVLSALDIVHGYEDGSFKPDGEITRAEAAVMIVGGLNMNADANAAAGTSKFTDVNEKASWATGFVNVGVAQGYINGMDDTTFAPQENVTYAQMCVMLTSILGYKEYAEAYGGWPTGYTTIAASTGINKGVSLSADTPLKRGQVAQMLYSTLTTPVLGVSEYSLTGNKYAPQDGSKGDFTTVLSDKFEGYAVNVKVVDTPSSSALEKGRVDLELTEDAFLDESQSKKPAIDPTTFAANTILHNAYADIDMEPYFLQSGKAIVRQDADKAWHVVYFSATDKDTKEYAAADLVDVTYDGTNAVFNFGSGKEIKIPAANFYGITKLYVNNVAKAPVLTLTANATIPELKNLIDAAQGTVRFTKNGSNYDGIFVDYYSIASVAAVKYDKGTATISFTRENGNGGLAVAASGKIVISDEAVADGTVEVLVTRNGEAAELTDIREDDIIAIYAGNLAGDITDSSKSVKILATDATETGRLDKVDDGEYTIGGTVYLLTNGASLATSVQAGTTFTAVLDPFGRIVKDKDMVSSVKYAVVVSYEDDEVTLLTKDGSKVTYKYDTSVAANLANIKAAMKNNIADRVVTYDLRTKTNTIYGIANVAAAGSTGAGAQQEYKSVAKKVGNILLSDETYIMNAQDAAYTQTAGVGTATTTDDEYKLDASKISSYAALSDGIEYEAYAWDKPTGTITYGFVIVKSAGTTFDASSRFAVGKSTLGSTTVDDDKVYSLTLADGTALNIATSAKYYDLTAGTASANVSALTTNDFFQGKAFFYTVDSDGYVDNIYIIFNATAVNTANVLTRAGKVSGLGLLDETKWTANLGFTTNPTQDIRLVYGLVKDVDGSSVTFVDDTANTTYLAGYDMMDTTRLSKFTFASDAAKYSYDINSTTATKKADKISEQGLAKSNFKLFEYKNDPSYVWQKVKYVPATTSTPASGDQADTSIATASDDDAWTDNANYAIAMIVNEQVVTIYEVVK